ncbi:translation initiation factor IF-2 [[Eubacterium] cellulosolvens]
MPIRQPVVAVLGHVDHGKTSLLDNIRGTSVASREPGSITQWIGASLLPAETLSKICGPLLEKLKLKITISGLLFIDTPGHETFANLRKRGGSAADIAILVIDVMKGVEPQTVESIEILRARKTPFMIAANKIDMILGWTPYSDRSFVESFEKQSTDVQALVEEKIYQIVTDLAKYNFNSERYDRIKRLDQFRTHVAIIPTSAKTGEGLPDLLAVLVGLTQAFMKEGLVTVSGPAKGVVLEVKEEVGLGMTINAIIYDGELKVNDTIILGGKEGLVITKVRALLLPKPLDEIRDPKDRFTYVESVSAASGVKIAAPDLDNALAGSSLYVIPKDANVEEFKSRIEDEISRLRIKTDKQGVTVKTDTLGSLEALTEMLGTQNIPVRFADVGDVSKRDIVEAEAVKIKDPILGVVLSFNVATLPDAVEEAKKWKVPLFESKIIYQLLEEYNEWAKNERLAKITAELGSLIRPAKIKVLRGCVFRRSKPCIFGVEVLAGILKAESPLIREDGKEVGRAHRIQDKGKDIKEAPVGSQVAISIEEAVFGRTVIEGDILYVAVPQRDTDILLSKFKDEMMPEEETVLNELLEIKTRMA